MLFNTLAYAQFFAVVFAITWLLALYVKQGRVRVLFWLLCSYAFYAGWDVRFLPLIFASSTIDWLLGNVIAGARTKAAKRRWLLVTVILNLGVLGFFKYFNFGIDSARAALMALGFSPPELALRIVLPVGISFFTFESMSYVIDVYRGDLEPHPSYLEYLCFVAFFPHLVAGPIVRPRDLLPQLAQPAAWSAAAGSEGLFLIALGLLKKVVIGDYLALNLVDRVFDSPLYYSALECYAAIVGYALQIYCDFSGYTDIAIGSALLLGVRFPLNFNSPYKAESIQDFWRRWHISLSTWLRDYLYIPLGGSHRGPVRTYINLMLTMLLGGLWHGANWTFVVWGGLHGAALALNRGFGEWRRSVKARQRIEPIEPVLRKSGPGTRGPVTRIAIRALNVFITFHFVCLCWVFFRAPTFGKARLLLEQLPELTTHHANLAPSVILVLALGIVTHLLPESWFSRAKLAFIKAPGVIQGLLLFFVALALRRMMSQESVPFVYFQF